MTKVTLHPSMNQMVQLAGELAEMFSFNRSLGQIFGFLYMTAEPVSLEEIAAACRQSKANASLHLRTLEHWGAVRKSWMTGTRKDYYAVTEDLATLATRRLQEGLIKRIDYAKQRLKTIKENPAFAETQGAVLGKRLEEIESLMHQVETSFQYLPKLLQLKKLFK